jgi:hypothetical protein
MIRKEQFWLIITDIRFWIIFFFLIRLIGITNAPLEIGHNWRQSLTCMVARNFMEGNPNLLYPKIDMAGNQTGIIGTEFPFYNYLIYLVSMVFGYTHWYGRLINLVVSSFGIYFFYKLAEKISNRQIAFNASILLLTSIWFAFSRKIMPDTFSVSLVIIGLYYGYTYLTSGNGFKLFLFFLYCTLGMLCKIPSLSLMAVLPLALFATQIPIKRRLSVLILSGIGIGIVCLWYFNWVPYLVNTYHYQLYFPKGLKEGFNEITPLLPQLFEKFYFTSLSSFIALPFFLIGIVFMSKDSNIYVKTGLVLITLTFMVFILKTGAVFPLHSYYIIPFTPVMALAAGFGLNRIPAKYLYIALVMIALEGTANQQHDFFIKKSEKYKLSLEEIANNNISKNDLIVINGGASPQEIYFAHRKGWTVENDKLNKNELNQLVQSGACCLIIDKKSFTQAIDYYPIIYSGVDFDIYKLN